MLWLFIRVKVNPRFYQLDIKVATEVGQRAINYKQTIKRTKWNNGVWLFSGFVRALAEILRNIYLASASAVTSTTSECCLCNLNVAYIFTTARILPGNWRKWVKKELLCIERRIVGNNYEEGLFFHTLILLVRGLPFKSTIDQ